jgi:hypothetical protein
VCSILTILFIESPYLYTTPSSLSLLNSPHFPSICLKKKGNFLLYWFLCLRMRPCYINPYCFLLLLPPALYWSSRVLHLLSYFILVINQFCSIIYPLHSIRIYPFYYQPMFFNILFITLIKLLSLWLINICKRASFNRGEVMTMTKKKTKKQGTTFILFLLSRILKQGLSLIFQTHFFYPLCYPHLTQAVVL